MLADYYSMDDNNKIHRRFKSVSIAQFLKENISMGIVTHFNYPMKYYIVSVIVLIVVLI